MGLYLIQPLPEAAFSPGIASAFVHSLPKKPRASPLELEPKISPCWEVELQCCANQIPVWRRDAAMLGLTDGNRPVSVVHIACDGPPPPEASLQATQMAF